jgi:hypothetical protein
MKAKEEEERKRRRRYFLRLFCPNSKEKNCLFFGSILSNENAREIGYSP